MKRLLILLPILFVSCQSYFGTLGEFKNFKIQKSGNELVFSWDQLDFTEYGKEWPRYAKKAEEEQDVILWITEDTTVSERYFLEKNVGKKTSVTVPVDDMKPGKYEARAYYHYLTPAGYLPASVQYLSVYFFTLDEHKEITSVTRFE